jgi:TonB family protein
MKVVVSLLLISIAATCTAADSKSVEAQQLLAQVKKNTQLYSDNVHPYHLRAVLTIYAFGSAPITGSADVKWASAERWRYEARFGQYGIVEIHTGKDQYWRKRSVSYEPNPARFVRTALDFAVPRVEWDEPALIKEVKHDSWHGIGVTCVTRQIEHGHSPRELCIDTAKALPLREPFDPYEWQYSDYISLAGKFIPRQLDLTKDGKPYVAIRLEKVESVPIADAEFAAGPGFEARPWCDKTTPAKPVKRPDPHYPPAARLQGLEATVVVFGEVGLDGQFHNPAVITTGGPDFDAEAIDALKNWRFQPASCHGIPIPVEINIEINFKLYH